MHVFLAGHLCYIKTRVKTVDEYTSYIVAIIVYLLFLFINHNILNIILPVENQINNLLNYSVVLR